jgi:hypothetical protein
MDDGLSLEERLDQLRHLPYLQANPGDGGIPLILLLLYQAPLEHVKQCLGLHAIRIHGWSIDLSIDEWWSSTTYKAM